MGKATPTFIALGLIPSFSPNLGPAEQFKFVRTPRQRIQAAKRWQADGDREKD
jgi:hypothetical protein